MGHFLFRGTYTHTERHTHHIRVLCMRVRMYVYVCIMCVRALACVRACVRACVCAYACVWICRFVLACFALQNVLGQCIYHFQWLELNHNPAAQWETVGRGNFEGPMAVTYRTAYILRKCLMFILLSNTAPPVYVCTVCIVVSQEMNLQYVTKTWWYFTLIWGTPHNSQQQDKCCRSS